MSRSSFDINATWLALLSALSHASTLSSGLGWDLSEGHQWAGDLWRWPCSKLSLLSFGPGFGGLTQMLFSGCSPTSWPDAAEARELLSDHHYPTNQPLHSVHRQGEGEAWAQVAAGDCGGSLKSNRKDKWSFNCHTCSHATLQLLFLTQLRITVENG